MTPRSSERDRSSQAEPVACFTVVGQADPGLLSRILEPFAKRGLVPARLHMSRAGGELHVDLQVAGMDPGLANQIARSLAQIWGVTHVLRAERQARRAA